MHMLTQTVCRRRFCNNSHADLEYNPEDYIHLVNKVKS